MLPSKVEGCRVTNPTTLLKFLPPINPMIKIISTTILFLVGLTGCQSGAEIAAGQRWDNHASAKLAKAEAIHAQSQALANKNANAVQDLKILTEHNAVAALNEQLSDNINVLESLGEDTTFLRMASRDVGQRLAQSESLLKKYGIEIHAIGKGVAKNEQRIDNFQDKANQAASVVEQTSSIDNFFAEGGLQ